MSLKNFSINLKLILTFMSIMSVCAFASALVFWKSLENQNVSDEVSRIGSITLKVDDALAAMLEQAVNQRGYLLFRSDSTYKDVFANREKMIKALDDARAMATGDTPVIAALDAMRQSADVFHTQLTEPQLAARRDTDKPISEIIEIGRNASRGQLDTFREAATTTKQEMGVRMERLTQAQEAAHFGIYAALGIGGALAGAIAVLLVWLLSRSIVRPVVGMTSAMSRLAEGDNNIEVPATDRSDEVGRMAQAVLVFKQAAIDKLRMAGEAETMREQSESDRRRHETAKARDEADNEFARQELGKALTALADGNVSYRIEAPFEQRLDGMRTDFNHALEKLEATLQAVGANAATIHSGTTEIRAATDELGRRTEQQAASVEQTAAALEEVTTTVRDSAKGAEQAGQLVARARSQAEKSGSVMQRAVSAMREIEKSSEAIGNIIGVIDEIAFQTNLLALNAGVEAARAGDAGKGFAVVAQEVRELAQRSANAAKEIKTLIGASGEQVHNGVTLVDETGRALQSIIAEVGEIDAHVAAIVTAAREQATGLQEINSAVNTIDQGTQQNAAMVEEQNAASHTLAREAQSLNELLSQFRFGGAAGFARSTTSAQPAPAFSAPRPPVTPVSRKPVKIAPTPKAVSATARPVASPAHALNNRLASALGAKQAPAASSEPDWTEF